jgi:hypothetical protein
MHFCRRRKRSAAIPQVLRLAQDDKAFFSPFEPPATAKNTLHAILP